MAPKIPFRVKAFVSFTATMGAVVLVHALLHSEATGMARFVCYLLIAILASTMKVRLPGMESTMSVHFLFVLLGVLELSSAETMLIGCVTALIQSTWKTKSRPEAIKVVFNVLGLTAPAIWLTYHAYHGAAHLLGNSTPVLLLVAACSYFLANTIPVSIVIALSQRMPLRKVWAETYFWSLPYYILGAALVGLIHLLGRSVGWENALLVLPLMYGLYRSYHLYLGRLEQEKRRVEVEARQVEAEKRHVEEVCALHLRTIEGLALAIEAKDHSTHSHLHRVRTYAVEIGKELALSAEQMDALRAAALLHDIGKLAVPDHIINKPSRLTPEEFEKMKIHPVVGSEILERVAFPYPVAPMVRSHHERWDGAGYPDGLRGEAIPIGARILSVVDCLDALTSDRQYRHPIRFEDALQIIVGEAGKSFDPQVVEVLQRRGQELEVFADRRWQEVSPDALQFHHSVTGSETPATGLPTEASGGSNPADFFSSIASARQEAHTLFEISQDLGNSLSLDETLSLAAMRLRKLIPYDSIVVYVRREQMLIPEFAGGLEREPLSELRFDVGSGLCGWVAQNARPVLNSHPELETGLVSPTGWQSGLQSVLAVPLEGVTGMVGVLALCRTEADAFTSEHLRVLQGITTRVALFLENALKFREAETSATRDYLTGMANARALSAHLETELARCKREDASFALMVCDLNGFKEINDRFGHISGDKVLKSFAQRLRAVCREYDYTARMGGDEFVILAPNMGARVVEERASLFSALAQEAGREVCGIDSLSLSLGAAFFPEDGTEAEPLLSEADRRMYTVKVRHHQTQQPAVSEGIAAEVLIGT